LRLGFESASDIAEIEVTGMVSTTPAPTAQYYDDVQDGPNTPLYSASSAKTDSNGDYSPETVNDGLDGNCFKGWHTIGTDNAPWLSMDFGSLCVRPLKFRMKSRAGCPVYAPLSTDIQGSHDGLLFTTLRSAPFNPNYEWASIASVDCFQYIRFSFQKNSAFAFVEIAEIELAGFVLPLPPIFSNPDPPDSIPDGQVLFFEPFDNATFMSVTPEFGQAGQGNFFGLVGATSDFGPSWDGDLDALDIWAYTGKRFALSS
jgi:hypothetical protein